VAFEAFSGEARQFMKSQNQRQRRGLVKFRHLKSHDLFFSLIFATKQNIRMKRGYETFGNTNTNVNPFVMNYVFEWYLRAFGNNVSFRHFSMPQKPIKNGGCLL